MKTPKKLYTDIIFTNVITKGVLIEPGKKFFAPPNQSENYFRLAFSSINKKIDAGIKLVASNI
tara:strand:- start:76 stop:264 length:189 start_codon:yes stop_codon:yes gene_type:complete